MSVVDTSPPAWYTYYPRPVAAAAIAHHPRDPSSMREKHSSPRKMVAVPAVVPCVSPKQGAVYPTANHQHHHQHHQQHQQHHQQHQQQQQNAHQQRRDRDDRDRRSDDDQGDEDDDDDDMMPFDLSRNGGSSPSSSPRSPLRSQRGSPAAFKPYDRRVRDDQPLDLRVDHKKSRRGDELEDENQNLIIRTPSPEDIQVDSPGPPSVHCYDAATQQPPPQHRDRNHDRNASAHSPCSSDKDVVVTDDRPPPTQLPPPLPPSQATSHRIGHRQHHNNGHHHYHQLRVDAMAAEEERHHRMVNYPVLFPPQQLHPMMLEAIYRAGAAEKSRLTPSLAGYQPGTGGYHRSSQHHYPYINPPLLNGHHHVPPPTYDVVRPPPPPPPPQPPQPQPQPQVARSPQQKSSSFQETSGKPKDR
uniref:Uncharacterized protein n=2 Tax=Sipha flava TaxID=143950 RepID=A0A2S2QP08_9HEMI